jgi:hypothetical protein
VDKRDHYGEESEDVENEDTTLEGGEEFDEQGVDEDSKGEHGVQEECSLPSLPHIAIVVKNKETLNDTSS